MVIETAIFILTIVGLYCYVELWLMFIHWLLVNITKIGHKILGD